MHWRTKIKWNYGEISGRIFCQEKTVLRTRRTRRRWSVVFIKCGQITNYTHCSQAIRITWFHLRNRLLRTRFISLSPVNLAKRQLRIWSIHALTHDYIFLNDRSYCGFRARVNVSLQLLLLPGWGWFEFSVCVCDVYLSKCTPNKYK